MLSPPLGRDVRGGRTVPLEGNIGGAARWFIERGEVAVTFGLRPTVARAEELLKRTGKLPMGELTSSSGS